MARVRKATRGEVLRAAQKDASYLEALEGKVGTWLGSNVLFTTKRALIQMQFTLYSGLISVISLSCQVSSLVVNLCGPTIWARWQKWLAPATSSIYYSLTTLRCCQTLGEEYTEIVQVNNSLGFQTK